MKAPPSVGIALGSGGARGFAHVVVLEAFDELGARPSIIAGTSIGALVGAGYAGGMTAADIKAHVRETFRARAELARKVLSARVGRVGDWLFAASGHPMLLDPERTVDLFLPKTTPHRFEALPTPLIVVAADATKRQEARFSAGPLRPAVAASLAVPGLFRAYAHEGGRLIDGGAINPLPFDALFGRADFIVAIDVTVGGGRRVRRISPIFETLLEATQLLQSAVIAEKIKARAPDLMLRPAVEEFALLDFLKLEEIFRATAPAKEALKRSLAAVFEGRSPAPNLREAPGG